MYAIRSLCLLVFNIAHYFEVVLCMYARRSFVAHVFLSVCDSSSLFLYCVV